MGRFAFLVRRYGFDVLVVLGAVGGAIDVLVRHDLRAGSPAAGWLSGAAVALVVLPLLGRRRYPFAAPAAVWLLAAAISFLDGLLIVSASGPMIAGLAAALLLGNLRDPVQGRAGLAVVVGATAVVVANDPGHDATDLVYTPALFAIAWLAGFALRERAEAAEAAEQRAAQAEREREVAEREREAAARVAVAEERARIARELHDVVAHSVSVMVLQVGAVRHRLPAKRAEDADALRSVERVGRTALTEMRRLLGALHDEGDFELAPQPGLDDLDALVEKVARAGLPVRVHVEGEPAALPRALDLSAYRIVQEGLTNSLKHSRAGRADVTVRYEGDVLQLEVRDDGSRPDGAGPHRDGDRVAPADGLGRGLVGIGERVKIYGGRMSAGPAPGGGFVLRASLPLEDHRP